MPGEGEVLVRLAAASVNAADWHIMRGEPRVARLMDRKMFGRKAPRERIRGRDLAGTVEGLTGFSLNPGDLWAHLTGGDDEPLKTSVDRAKLEAAIRTAETTLDTEVVEGSISFPEGKVKVVRPVVGQRLSVEGTADQVEARWPTSAPVAAKFEQVAPKVSAEEVERANRYIDEVSEGF